MSARTPRRGVDRSAGRLVLLILACASLAAPAQAQSADPFGDAATLNVIERGTMRLPRAERNRLRNAAPATAAPAPAAPQQAAPARPAPARSASPRPSRPAAAAPSLPARAPAPAAPGWEAIVPTIAPTLPSPYRDGSGPCPQGEPVC